MKNVFAVFFLLGLFTAGCGPQRASNTSNVAHVSADSLSDDSLMTLVQYRTFQYFWDGAEPTSGAARERYHSDNVYPENDKHIITSGGTGFGVMAILVGIERKFI